MELMNHMKLSWITCFESSMDFKWIDYKNEEQIDWVWKYCKARSLIDLNILVMTNQDKYWAIRTSFDFLKSTPIETERIIKKLKASHYKYLKRIKNTQQKQYNFIMDKLIVIKLGEIKLSKGGAKNKVIEELINEKYIDHLKNNSAEITKIASTHYTSPKISKGTQQIQCNFTMDKSITAKLSEIKHSEGVPRNRVIEDLINKKHALLFKER